MQANNKHNTKATVAVQQATVQLATGVAISKVIVNNTMVRMQQRIAVLQAARAAKNAARKQLAAQQAYQLQVAQLAATYNQPAPVFNAVVVSKQARANSATVAPSSALVYVGGTGYKPCKAVHALCETLPANATRAQQMQLCTDNGINRATASTQIGLYRAALAKAAAAAVQ